MTRITRSFGRMITIPAVSAAVVVATAACGSGNGPTPTSNPTASGSPSSSSAGNGASDHWFTSVKSCDMVDTTTLTQLGFTSPGSVAANNSVQNRCDWNQQNATLGVELATQPYHTLLALGGQLSDLTIAGRPAEQDYVSSANNCGVAVEATKGSRALIIAVTLDNTSDRACTIAKTVAQAIAPKLPSLSG